jgi:AcrR family transcriptional regulator
VQSVASRTRERLIDVARQLFARKGIENTTMNDIASASDKGRRTIYTYFRTKSDIYQAVIEAESRKICEHVERNVAKATSPHQKLRALMISRAELAEQTAQRPELWLSDRFSRDAKRSNLIAAMVNDRLVEMITEIINEGVTSGEFNRLQATRLPILLTMLVRGTDWTLLSQSGDDKLRRHLRQITDFVIGGLVNDPAKIAISENLTPLLPSASGSEPGEEDQQQDFNTNR